MWQGRPSSGGHGQIGVNGKIWGTHRIMFVSKHGSVPDGLQVLHTCDVNNCCNPDHLYAGTAQQNALDAATRGKKRKIITQVDADEIMLRYWVGQTAQEIADYFDIKLQTVYNITSGRIWRGWM